MEINAQLNDLMAKFKAQLPHKEGLLLHPELRRELKLSRKKKLALTTTSQLKATLTQGRKKGDSAYRNRVGKKAQTLRKV